VQHAHAHLVFQLQKIVGCAAMALVLERALILEYPIADYPVRPAPPQL
jgi:hypothetical protein